MTSWKSFDDQTPDPMLGFDEEACKKAYYEDHSGAGLQFPDYRDEKLKQYLGGDNRFAKSIAPVQLTAPSPDVIVTPAGCTVKLPPGSWQFIEDFKRRVHSVAIVYKGHQLTPKLVDSLEDHTKVEVDAILRHHLIGSDADALMKHFPKVWPFPITESEDLSDPAVWEEKKAEPAPTMTVIQLTPSEIQSGSTRVDWAEALIRQLPEDHDGRNSWLLNYGKKEAQHCSEERPCTPCFSDNGACEDTPKIDVLEKAEAKASPTFRKNLDTLVNAFAEGPEDDGLLALRLPKEVAAQVLADPDAAINALKEYVDGNLVQKHDDQEPEMLYELARSLLWSQKGISIGSLEAIMVQWRQGDEAMALNKSYEDTLVQTYVAIDSALQAMQNSKRDDSSPDLELRDARCLLELAQTGIRYALPTLVPTNPAFIDQIGDQA